MGINDPRLAPIHPFADGYNLSVGSSSGERAGRTSRWMLARTSNSFAVCRIAWSRTRRMRLSLPQSNSSAKWYHRTLVRLNFSMLPTTCSWSDCTEEAEGLS